MSFACGVLRSEGVEKVGVGRRVCRPTTTIIRAVQLAAVEFRFPEAHIHFVVGATEPLRRILTRSSLWWPFLQQFLEVRGAVAAGV